LLNVERGGEVGLGEVGTEAIIDVPIWFNLV
jgi:hypothetical protein